MKTSFCAAVIAVFVGFLYHWRHPEIRQGAVNHQSHAGLPDPLAFAGTTELKGSLADPLNIDLRWTSKAEAAGSFHGGYIIEYTNRLKDDFVIVDAVGPGVGWARHPDLAPKTHFIYRVRPFFGKASVVASVTTGKAPDELSHGKPQENARDPNGAGRNSLRDPGTVEKAAPADFKATLESPRVVDLTWKDCASDEEGYFLQASDQPDRNFKVIAYLEPNTISYQISLLPEDKTIYFRLWPFIYGKASNPVELDTGGEPQQP